MNSPVPFADRVCKHRRTFSKAQTGLMADNSGNPPEWGRQWSDFWRLAGVSFTVALLAGAGAAGGMMLDRRLGTKPVFSLGLLLLGLAAGAWYAYKALMEMLK